MSKQKINGVKHRNELNVVQKIIMWLFLAFVGVIMFLPMWNVLVVSTTTTLEASRSGVQLWWRKFSIEGFEYVFRVSKLARPFLNSLFVTTVGTVIQVGLSSIAGYVLIQRDLPFKGILTTLFC